MLRPLTSRCARIVMLVRLYAHYAGASFLHKFAQALQSGDRGRYCTCQLFFTGNLVAFRPVALSQDCCLIKLG